MEFTVWAPLENTPAISLSQCVCWDWVIHFLCVLNGIYIEREIESWRLESSYELRRHFLFRNRIKEGVEECAVWGLQKEDAVIQHSILLSSSLSFWPIPNCISWMMISSHSSLLDWLELDWSWFWLWNFGWDFQFSALW